MVQLAGWRERFEGLGLKLAAMTYDELPELKSFHQAESIGFPLLRDEQARHVNLFQVRDLGYQKASSAYGIPYPGIFWIAPDGRIKAKFAVPGFRDRPPLNEVYDEIKRLLPNQTKNHSN